MATRRAVNAGEAGTVAASEVERGRAPSHAEQARADRERVAGRVVRAVRRSLGYSRDELRDSLRVGPASLARYELGDAPPWIAYALIGVGVLERGVPVDEMVRRVAAEEDAAGDGDARADDRRESPVLRTEHGPAGDALAETQPPRDAGHR